MAIVTRNRCVIEVFGGVFVLSLCVFGFFVGIGALVRDLTQISSFLLTVLSLVNWCFNRESKFYLCTSLKAGFNLLYYMFG